MPDDTKPKDPGPPAMFGRLPLREAYIQRAINRLREQGIRIPDDIAITSFPLDESMGYGGQVAGSFSLDKETSRPRIQLNQRVGWTQHPGATESALLHELSHAREAEGMSRRAFVNQATDEARQYSYDQRPSEIAARRQEIPSPDPNRAEYDDAIESYRYKYLSGYLPYDPVSSELYDLGQGYKELEREAMKRQLNRGLFR